MTEETKIISAKSMMIRDTAEKLGVPIIDIPLATNGPVKIVDAQGVHPSRLDQAVLEEQLYKQGRLRFPTDDMIFVFGSNLLGRHGAGAAKFAAQKKGALNGLGYGPAGKSFAIPTKDSYIRTLPLSDISRYVNSFVGYARMNGQLKFQVTAIGCGLAGYQPMDIAPMFTSGFENCYFDTDWESSLPPQAKFWGHI